jgi:nicotinamidase-related amidase
MIRHADLLRPANTVLLMIDMQDNMVRRMVGPDSITANCVKLLEIARCVSVPVVVTEHNLKVFGPTLADLKARVQPFEPLHKMIFSAMAVDEVASRLKSLGRRQLVIFGIETHICIAQTALDAIAQGYEVHVVADAVSARGEFEHRIALKKLRDCGAMLTSAEMAIFELLERAGTPEFRKALPLIKG